MKAVIEDIIHASPSVKRFYLRFPGLTEFHFLPGQFITLSFPEEGDLRRSYSIASEPDHSNAIELCVVLNPGGKVTPHLWNYTRGAELECSEALGTFVLPGEISTDICFICTGTGVAPFRSMIRHLLRSEQPHQRVYLIFGARYEADLLYRSEFEQLAADYPEFRYIPVLSRQTDWNGVKGYVHGVYEELFADGRDARFMVCGWQTMCHEARTRLKLMGYNRRQYQFEEYDG